MSTSNLRHLSSETFAGHLSHTAPMDHPVPGEPRLVLFTVPGHRVGLRGPARSGEQPAPTGLEHVNVRTIHHGGRRMIELIITDPRVFLDAYPLLRAVADRVQLGHQPMTSAVRDTLRQLGHLLQPEATLRRSAETGMLGELCLFTGVVLTAGPAVALQAWRGALSEEHDFGFPGFDVEVKATTYEHRRHTIDSLTQLVPTGKRPLWLVSFQITVAGHDGATLPELIGRSRALLSAGADQIRFDDLLHAAGWADRHTTSCSTRWRLRTPPAAFIVDADFPRITPALLQPQTDLARVTDVRYRIDLTGWPENNPPDLLRAALGAGKQELR
ncbi:PD-(D/E)XK motif protein [Micromonospora sp. DT233]|uniref:PD-(D/E)XK motif protein n=1 Tax=Micromonospora sp. DT233 TaxID=3393432 RepID=UPI003CEE4C68